MDWICSLATPPAAKEAARPETGSEDAAAPETTVDNEEVASGADKYPRPAGHAEQAAKATEDEEHKIGDQAKKEDPRKEPGVPKAKTVFEPVKQPVLNKNPALNKAANIKQPSGKVMT